ncbi:glycosyltransferase family 4 protein [Methanocella arvoryzae]|uniref:Glycosyltransferase (Group 1) n=1 Tax=Methanocella arvoryzae (strain DSM 22066 / NBRC 105507 / MRE50) TaxID=351160 RepID=Q0W813_METAR|nr:glycosyltransferase family 4 protein [Methanocella arvoryzae]CAJ35480.1 putative glycosyltransferase (group 1) [Methanocella arvoryzae MRE50]
MDVAFVTTRLVEKDAQGNFTEATLRELRKRCGKVTLFTFAYERSPVEGVDIRYVGGSNGHSIGANVRALLSTGKLARELATYDLLVLAGPDVGVLPAVHRAKKLNPRIRLFWVYHSLTPSEFLPSLKDRLLTMARKRAYLWSMMRSDTVQTFSFYVKSELLAEGIEDSLIRPEPFAIDTRAFATGDKRKIRAKHGLESDFVLLYVGRLAPAKRVDRLIEAMKGLDGDIALVIVGGGPERERLETMAKASGKKVIFAGRVPDEELPDYYAACDTWVTASEHEGFCVPIVEAMAAGKPVVVPFAGAMPETAGDAGLIYEQGNTRDMVACIQCLREDRKYYESLAGRAVDSAKYFDIGRVMPAYVETICNSGRR